MTNSTNITISLAELLRIAAGDSKALNRVTARELGLVETINGNTVFVDMNGHAFLLDGINPARRVLLGYPIDEQETLLRYNPLNLAWQKCIEDLTVTDNPPEIIPAADVSAAWYFIPGAPAYGTGDAHVSESASVMSADGWTRPIRRGDVVKIILDAERHEHGDKESPWVIVYVDCEKIHGGTLTLGVVLNTHGDTIYHVGDMLSIEGLLANKGWNINICDLTNAEYEDAARRATEYANMVSTCFGGVEYIAPMPTPPHQACRRSSNPTNRNTANAGQHRWYE